MLKGAGNLQLHCAGSEQATPCGQRTAVIFKSGPSPPDCTAAPLMPVMTAGTLPLPDENGNSPNLSRSTGRAHLEESSDAELRSPLPTGSDPRYAYKLELSRYERESLSTNLPHLDRYACARLLYQVSSTSPRTVYWSRPA